MVLHSHTRQKSQGLDHADVQKTKRADIIDRNGVILATHLVTGSVYANPKVILNPEDAALKLSKLFPDLGYDNLLKKLVADLQSASQFCLRNDKRLSRYSRRQRPDSLADCKPSVTRRFGRLFDNQ